MIVDYKSIPLFGQTLFSWVSVRTPARFTGAMASQEACFAYVLEGESSLYSEKEKLRAQATEAVLSKCGTYVTKLFSRNKGGLYSAITVHFHEAVLKKVYAQAVPHFLKEQPPADHPNMAKVAATTLIRQFFENIQFYFKHPELITEDILVLKLKEIILILLQTNNAPLIFDLLHHLYAKRTFGFKEVVEAHICSAISLAELASLTHHSLSSFKREFKKLYADTPEHYFIQKRTEKVAELLLVSDESLSTIAWECGFKSLAHMSRVFKARYGVAPSGYRESLNRNNESGPKLVDFKLLPS